jgi:hypothetical protein
MAWRLRNATSGSSMDHPGPGLGVALDAVLDQDGTNVGVEVLGGCR